MWFTFVYNVVLTLFTLLYVVVYIAVQIFTIYYIAVQIVAYCLHFTTLFTLQYIVYIVVHTVFTLFTGTRWRRNNTLKFHCRCLNNTSSFKRLDFILEMMLLN